MHIVDKKLSQFIEDIASARPIPGGGNVSAVAAAQAAALISMACEVSLKREKSPGQKVKLAGIGTAARTLAAFGLSLAEWDAEVFSDLMACFKKKYTSGAKRKKTIQQALKFCTASCLDLAVLARSGVQLSLEASRVVRPDMRSEVRTALGLWEAAFSGAEVNVEANLEWVKDRGTRAQARRLIKDLALGLKRDRNALLRKMNGRGKRQ